MKLYKSLKSASIQRDDVRALKLNLTDETLPLELFHFQHLEELYLDGNCRSIPQDLSAWSNLKVLSIKFPNFSGELSSLFNLPRLENLKIIETPFKQFLLPLGHSASPLKSLTIKNCGLTRLPEEISMLGHLTDLNLSGNHLSSLPNLFIDLINLKRLNLDQNHFQIFPDPLKKMKKLIHLSIDQNRFSEEERERIQREFHIWPNN